MILKQVSESDRDNGIDSSIEIDGGVGNGISVSLTIIE